MAIAVLLGFHCLLRVNELVHIRVEDFADSNDPRLGTTFSTASSGFVTPRLAQISGCLLLTLSFSLLSALWFLPLPVDITFSLLQLLRLEFNSSVPVLFWVLVHLMFPILSVMVVPLALLWMS